MGGRCWAVPLRFAAETYARDEQVARADATFEQRARGEPNRGRPGLDRLPEAAATADRLITTASRQVLLHGDFVTKNLVRDAASPAGWVALDPLPHLGEPASEVGAFAAYQPAALVLPTAEALAARTGVDPDRALRWAAVWIVHQTAQAWRADQESLQEVVVSTTVTQLLGA